MFRASLISIKLLLSLCLIWYAFGKVDTGAAVQYLRSISIEAIVLTLLLLFLQMVVSALRLRELLTLLGAKCRATDAIDVVMIGAFFSQTMISFVGGDAMRIWRITRSNTSVGTATKGIFLDRAAGFVALLVIILVGLPFLLQLIRSPELKTSLLVAISMFVAGLVCFLFLYRMPASFKQWRVLRWAASLSEAAIRLSRQKKGLIALLGFSLVIQILNIVILYVIARALSIEISLLYSLALFPPVLFMSMLPISVAGWGVREGAMVAALNMIGVPAHQSLALSICFGLCALAVSLPGGVLWFVGRSHHRGEYAAASGSAGKE